MGEKELYKPRLSIIVPVYNVEKYIRGSVDSILKQTFTDFELILVDDGSTDGCGKICDEYALSDTRVRVIHQKHAGVSDARNRGIDTARGAVVGFVDSDDAICTDMYEKMLCCMDASQADIVFADAYIVKKGIKTFKRPIFEQDRLLNRTEAVNGVLDGTIDNAVWNKIYKKEVIGNIRFPSGRVYEDVATVYKIMDRADRVGYLCKPLYYYIKRKGSITNTSFNSKGRYDCFCGYKERAEFSGQQQLECADRCRVMALEAALSALTAFYAVNESHTSDKYLDVTGFIENHNISQLCSQLKPKHRFLIYCYRYCVPVYKLYAFLSAGSKSLINILKN